MKKDTPRTLTTDDVQRPKAPAAVKTGVKAGPTRRKDIDHVGLY